MEKEFSIGAPSSIMFHQITNPLVAEKLFTGFDEFHFVSYTTSFRVLLKLFKSNKFKKIEGIIGENMTDNYKKELKDDLDSVSSIMNKIKSKEWLIYIKKKNKATIHDKFYLLQNKDITRVIIGSPNLSETGLYGRGQKNIVLSIDYKHPINQTNSKVIEHFLEYIKSLKADCDLSMQNLISLIEGDEEDIENRDRIIERWLSESDEEFKENETNKVIKELNDQVLDRHIDGQSSFTIKLPESKSSQKALDKILPENLFHRTADHKIVINTNSYFKHIKEIVQYPLMQIKNRNNERIVFLTLETDNARLCTSIPESSQNIYMALENLEDFCNTVELGQTENPFRAKMVFYEAILYFLNAPFSHELMKAKKETVGIADDTGLQYLFVCGLGANSKTQLIRYMLKVLTGQLIDPLPVDQFTSKKVDFISKLGTVFPIVADDVRNEKLSAREDLFKNYWEKHWSHENDCPQIIVTTNYRNILNKEWATRRIKGLDFDVVFKKNQENSQKLNKIMALPNPIFEYFSYDFLNKTDIKKFFRVEDELNVARHVMKELYKKAGRTLPKYFPEKPVEEMFDKNWEKWVKSIKLGKMKIKYKNKTVQVLFSHDMRFEIQPHLKALPQELVAEVHGDMIICDRINEFKEWLYRSDGKGGLWDRLFS